MRDLKDLRRQPVYVPSPGATMPGWEGDKTVPGTRVRLQDLGVEAQNVARKFVVERHTLQRTLEGLKKENARLRIKPLPWWKRRPRCWRRATNYLRCIPERLARRLDPDSCEELDNLRDEW